ncbi:MAG: hypothetical protein VE96_C0005G0048 [candidate division Kazan bacterium GW2011_GWA1_44_22]|uniref:Uncharacterized protein n=1 Tax=candidate division Kazan bacterium GW2011_GWA1_44_22 TaxID=1620410 RepID=A0A0G1KYH5_UNCK3|nr:MAG: hypothetical protein VE96_C0005G0048 [candidate division Kazan bacterium GW2011_GWA1_44_22]
MKKETLYAVVIIIALGLIAYLVQSAPHPSNRTEQNTTDSDRTESGVNIKTYTSDNLKVSFQYFNNEKTQVVNIRETVNKILLQVQGKKEKEQSVEVFDKDPKDNLVSAIRKKFLADISRDDCKVMVLSLKKPNYFSYNIETAEIQYGFAPVISSDPRISGSPCPSGYTQVDGVKYFWMDRNHPDRFFFFNIGQYSIFAEDPSLSPSRSSKHLGWEDTFVATELKSFTNKLIGYKIGIPSDYSVNETMQKNEATGLSRLVVSIRRDNMRYPSGTSSNAGSINMIINLCSDTFEQYESNCTDPVADEVLPFTMASKETIAIGGRQASHYIAVQNKEDPDQFDKTESYEYYLMSNGKLRVSMRASSVDKEVLEKIVNSFEFI